MTGIWQPSDEDLSATYDQEFSTNATTRSVGNLYSAGCIDWDEMRGLMKRAKEIEHEALRTESLMVEKMECSVCHRKPIVCNDGFGKVYLVCQHQYAALQREVPSIRGDGSPRPLGSIRIELFDDGPRAW